MCERKPFPTRKYQRPRPGLRCYVAATLAAPPQVCKPLEERQDGFHYRKGMRSQSGVGHDSRQTDETYQVASLRAVEVKGERGEGQSRVGGANKGATEICPLKNATEGTPGGTSSAQREHPEAAHSMAFSIRENKFPSRYNR